MKGEGMPIPLPNTASTCWLEWSGADIHNMAVRLREEWQASGVGKSLNLVRIRTLKP
jgi:hypothetical protein